MSKNCIDIHTPHLKSKFNKLIKSGVKEKDAELEIALEEAKRIFNSLNNLKTKLGLKLSEEDEITNAIVTTKAEDFQDLSETFDLEGELKTKIDALEKIIKDAESEDAPATVKQELIEKGNAKLAEMKAELAALKTPKEKLQENINDLNIVQDISLKAQEIKNKAQSKLDELNKTEGTNLISEGLKDTLNQIRQTYTGGVEFFSPDNQTGFEALQNINSNMEKYYGGKVTENDLYNAKDFFPKGKVLYNWLERAYTELSGKTFEKIDKQETPIEKLRRLAKEKIEESKLQFTSEFNYRGGTYTIDYKRNLLSPIPKTATAQKNLIDFMDKQKIEDKKVYDISIKKINDKDVYLVYHNFLDKFVFLDKNLNSIPLDESVVTSKAYQDAQNRCK